MSHICVISGKESWQDREGNWYSNGGFPLQMRAIASLFDRVTLLVTHRDQPGNGGIRLPETAEIVVVRNPVGTGLRRKIWVLGHLGYLLSVMIRNVRRADVVHVPPPGDIPLLGMLVALSLKKRLIVRYCGSWLATARTTMANRISRGLMRVFAGGRNVMLATGEADNAPARKISWIFSTALSSAELGRVQPDCNRGLNSPARLAYIGRLHYEKGVAHLIEALAMLKADGFAPLPHVTIIGDGPERAALMDRARSLGLSARFSFVGQLDREALNRILTEVDLCVQPSLTEGFSKAWLDALACGIPIVATDAGAARQVIGSHGERGWLVRPGDVVGLAGQLKRVLTEPANWAELRRRGRVYAEGRTLESWAKAIGQLCSRQWNVPFVSGKLVVTKKTNDSRRAREGISAVNAKAGFQ